MGKSTWQFIYTAVLLMLLANNIYAGKKDLFVDGQGDDGAMEFDPEFQDDFDDAKLSSGTSSSPGMVITDSYNEWSERDLWRKERSISFLGGNDTVASTYHFLVFPQARFDVAEVYSHLGVPLRFPVYDNGDVNSGLRRHGFVSGESFITPRQQDFRNFFDIQRIVRHMEIGDPYGSYFFRLSRLHALTMGQGELVKDMSPGGLYDHDFIFLTGQMTFDNLRVSGFLGPLIKAHMVGLSTRITPLYNIDASPFVRNINFELAYVNDFFAPNMVNKKGEAFILDDERRQVKREEGLAQGFSLGAANEFLVLPWLSLKPYASVGNMWLSGLKTRTEELLTRHGAGFHFGHDASFIFFPGTKKSILQLKTEARFFSRRYSPGYFGSTYLIDRLTMKEKASTDISADNVTKSQYLGQHQGRLDWRYGYLMELAYAYEKNLTAVMGYENARTFYDGSQIAPMRKLHFVLGFLGLDLIKGHIGYQATSINDIAEIFDFEKSRGLLALRGQLKLMPFLYFDMWAKHSFGINDMFRPSDEEGGNAMWLSNQAETRSFNFGLGLEFAMTF